MRTSFDLSDALLKRAKRLAHDRGVPLRDLVEEGLHLVLSQAAPQAAGGFDIDKFVSRQGGGLVEGLDWSDWERIREITYGDRW